MSRPIRARFIGGPYDGQEMMLPTVDQWVEVAVFNPWEATGSKDIPIGLCRVVYRLVSAGELLATYMPVTPDCKHT